MRSNIGIKFTMKMGYTRRNAGLIAIVTAAIP
jgi:hypothetical protein